MDYFNAVDYLNTFTDQGIVPDLSRIKFLCQRLHQPQLSYPTIHITGTNGKTSTAWMLGSLLSSLGFKVGTFTSPHLVSYTERITLNGQDISRQEFGNLLEELIPYFNEVNSQCKGPKLTQFEALTAMAFLYFMKKKVDCAVIEVGMGGCWDATNMVKPQVAVITNISLEHTDRLGRTLEEIAREKSGIIKKGGKVVTAVREKKLLSILKEKCQAEKAQIKILGKDFDVFWQNSGVANGQNLIIRGLYNTYANLTLPLRGQFQAFNAALAVVSLECFLSDKRGLLTKLADLLPQAFAKFKSPGRLEKVVEIPRLILDGAHNPAGALNLAHALKSNFEYDKLILVLGILRDKDIEGIISALVPLAWLTVVSQSKSNRSFSASKLGREVSRFTKNFVVEKDLKKAVWLALEKAGQKDLILVTGSLYTIGEVKEFLPSLKRELWAKSKIL